MNVGFVGEIIKTKSNFMMHRNEVTLLKFVDIMKVENVDLKNTVGINIQKKVMTWRQQQILNLLI